MKIPKIQNRRRYAQSKGLYLFLIWISLPVDACLAIVLYEVLSRWLNNILSLTGVILLLSGILGGFIYLLDRAQMEYLTGGKHD